MTKTKMKTWWSHSSSKCVVCEVVLGRKIILSVMSSTRVVLVMIIDKRTFVIYVLHDI